MPLIRNGCLNVTVSRRDLVKISFLELAGAPRDSTRIESFSRFPPTFVVNRLFAAFRTTALLSGA